MIPASASSQERRTASEQRQGHRLQGEKSNIIFCMVTYARHDDITANRRQQPYHISVEHTAAHTGWAGPTKTTTGPTPQGGGGGDKARNDDITTNKRQQPYHTSVEHTAPRRRGGANQKHHRPHSTAAGRGRGQTRPDGESNKPKQDNYPSDRQGGIPWVGGVRGGVAALHHIYLCVCVCLFVCLFLVCFAYLFVCLSVSVVRLV